MKKIKPAIIETLFYLLIVFIFVGEFFQINYLVNNWIFLTTFAKVGEIFAMAFFPIASLFVFCDLFIGFRRKSSL